MHMESIQAIAGGDPDAARMQRLQQVWRRTSTLMLPSKRQGSAELEEQRFLKELVDTA